MRRFICALVLMTILGTASGQKANGDVLITLERTTCFGTCPAYKLTIRGDGSVTYEGHKFVRVEGTRQSTIDNAAVAELLKAFVDADYFGFKDSYTSIQNPDGTVSVVTDLPSTYTSLTFKGKSKKVYDYVGAPKGLEELENKIDEIAGSKRWITIDAATVHEEASNGWNVRGLEAKKLFLLAAEAGDVEVVKAFIKEGADVNARDYSGQSAVNYAARGLAYQDELAKHPRSDEDRLPNYAEKYKEIRQILVAAGATDEKSSTK